MHEEDVRRMLRAELSFKTRAAYLVGLLLTATFAIALLSLWLTERHLPVRTHVAFALLVAINIGWSTFCGWALAQRKVLYSRQGVIAGRLAVLWSAVFVVGALAAGYASGRAGAGLLAALLGILLLGAAVLMLRHATARHQQLLQLRQSLGRLGGRAGAAPESEKLRQSARNQHDRNKRKAPEHPAVEDINDPRQV